MHLSDRPGMIMSAAKVFTTGAKAKCSCTFCLIVAVKMNERVQEKNMVIQRKT